MRVFLDLMWYFKQAKWRYLSGIFILAIVSFLELIPPKVVGVVVDLIQGNTVEEKGILIKTFLFIIGENALTEVTLMKLIGILLFTGFALYGLRFVWRIMIFGSAHRLSRLLRNRLYEHFTNMSPNFYQKRRIGDLMAHSTNDLVAIQMTAGAGVLTLVDSITLGSFVLIAMATTISWKLTLIALIPMPFMALATKLYGSMLHKRFHKAQEAFSSLNDKVQESISGVRVIKTFGQEDEDIEAFRKESDDVVAKNVSVAKVDSLFDPTISLIVGLSFFLAITFGARFVVNGEMTLGELTSFTIYLGLLIWPMLAFGWLFNIVERGRASYDRVSSLLKVKKDIVDKEDAIDEKPTGDIEYNISSFLYPNTEESALTNIKFSLKRGQTVGIVGKTGSGKTTLLKLLTREFDITNGTISIGDEKITDYTMNGLRSALGYVPQDHFLFSATIAENIAFAKPEANRKQVINAAKLANIHEDILRFENGYETTVGERGVTLSGGQKQRISIARALMMEPEILMLDDSLSAVDAKTEEQILTALRNNRQGKTTFITAHRLSAIEHADLILVLDEGKIVQRGSHMDLMNEEGWYKKMYNRQQLESEVEQGGATDEK
ncbi:multidrug ABC transporter permease/ATP-binding protein [Lottiidibacillus patelloidae]|uniref:Multidrug ABC transporter permease/ATP-binding protein n=1 Tax=Lottiidibacillus patelloidae TaxID=2670334 RepID=A0A263BUZ2_9BACI|nr:ABC transporter transmembrane domain-containing protein [Lottiidibacillus patelloidae]OZM57539.1 multidrug ABC transporter permease/ATP-binding protein [Lottiidibacillus patelloidae]